MKDKQFKRGAADIGTVRECHARGLMSTGGRSRAVSAGVALFSDAVRFTPDFAFVHNNLGNALMDKGRIDEAIAHYSDAVRLKSDYDNAQSNLGIALVKQGRLQDGVPHFSEALRANPGNAAAQVWLNQLTNSEKTGKR